MNVTSSVDILSASGAEFVPSSAAADPQRAAAVQEQRAFVALDYHNRAAELLAASDRTPASLREAAMFAQLALNFAQLPDQMPGTLYNLARAQALLGDSNIVGTLRMFREIVMPPNLRQAVINGDPDFAQIENMTEFHDVVELFRHIAKSRGLAELYNKVEIGFVAKDKMNQQLTIVNRSTEEPVEVAFVNKSKLRLFDMVFLLRFVRPLALSGTNRALTLFPLTRHGRSPSSDAYMVEYTLTIPPEDGLAARFELNTSAEAVKAFTITVDYSSPETSRRRTELQVIHAPSVAADLARKE